MFKHALLTIAALALLTSTAVAQDITLQKYYRSNGREITQAQYDAEMQRCMSSANKKGPVNEQGLPKYDNRFRPIDWPYAKAEVIRQKYRVDGRPMYDNQGRILIYDRGPEYMARRLAEEQAEAEAAASGDYKTKDQQLEYIDGLISTLRDEKNAHLRSLKPNQLSLEPSAIDKRIFRLMQMKAQVVSGVPINNQPSRQDSQDDYVHHIDTPLQSPAQVNRSGFDQYGTFYMPAAGGNLIKTDDGTLMQKTAGGYINTRTGQFSPAN